MTSLTALPEKEKTRTMHIKTIYSRRVAFTYFVACISLIANSLLIDYALLYKFVFMLFALIILPFVQKPISSSQEWPVNNRMENFFLLSWGSNSGMIYHH